MCDILIQCDKINVPLIIAFGDLGGYIKGFQFRTSLKDLTCNKIFCKDSCEAWYYKGMKEFSSNYHETIQNLKHLIEIYKPTKLIMLGYSAGAYAALVLGIELKANCIISIAPQIVLNRTIRTNMEDLRWEKEIQEIETCLDFDLYNDISKLDFSNVDMIKLIVGEKDNLDIKQAELILKWPNLQLIYENGNHFTVGIKYRDTGKLRNLLFSMLLV